MLTWTKNSTNTGYETTGATGRYYSILRNNGKFRLAGGGGREDQCINTLGNLKAKCENIEAQCVRTNVVTPVVVEGDASPLAKAIIAPVIDQLIAEGVVPTPVNGYQINRGGQHGPSPLDGAVESIAETREYTYAQEVRGVNGIVHRAGDVVIQGKDRFGNWRDEDVLPKTDVIPVPPARVVSVAPKLGTGLLAALANRPKDTSPHLIVEARAGTGKTTTLIEGLKRIKGCPTEGFVPSPQQAAVFAAMEQSKGLASSIMFVAFNKSIADELKQRVPAGCEASTMHGLGFKAVNQAFRGLRVEQHRVSNIIGELMGRDVRDLRREKPALVQATEKLVGLCKMNLVGWSITDAVGTDWDGALTELAAHYDVDLDKDRAEVFTLVPRVLERCKDVEWDKCLNFDDMIWLPVVLNLSVARYDILLVDEAQDLNRCQQELAKRAGRRLILCGDPKQAIYGFAGADSQSMNRMWADLETQGQAVHQSCGGAGCDQCCNGVVASGVRGCVILPLTVTRRCGKAIVKEAQKFVPDFSAFETNPEGTVTYSRMESKDEVVPADRIYRSLVQDGDMVLCRVNAPLVKECFRFLKAGRKANIQGRDIGQGLISTVTKMKAVSIPDLVTRLGAWLDQETAKELAKKNPSETRIEAIQDRLDCLMCFTDGQTTVDGVVRRIESVFTDDKTVKGIRLSSVHKAKGLEAHQVFILQGKGCNGGGKRKDDKPEPAWVAEQNRNLRYVAITRAIESLVYVS